MSSLPLPGPSPIGDKKRALRSITETAPRRTKRPEDTFAGCEALAASDRARAAKMETRNGRLKLEHSAASWQERAALLQRLEASFDKRKALDKAEWERADAEEQLSGRERMDATFELSGGGSDDTVTLNKECLSEAGAVR